MLSKKNLIRNRFLVLRPKSSPKVIFFVGIYDLKEIQLVESFERLRNFIYWLNSLIGNRSSYWWQRRKKNLSHGGKVTGAVRINCLIIQVSLWYQGNWVERETGFEPATSTLARLRSTNWASIAFSFICFLKWKREWRRLPESNRGPRICNPLHSHSAKAPFYFNTLGT